MLFVVVLFYATANIYSQNFQINFAGIGTATTVDSVKVENLTKGTSLSLLGTDVLHLIGTNGINNLIPNEEIAIVYPTPMQSQAELSFYAKESGNTQIIIFDITGKMVVKINNTLSKGFHKYEITGLREGVYAIKISGEQYQYTVKLISNNNFQNNSSITYLGKGKQAVIQNTLRSTKSIVDMAYTTGDNLRFTGYANNCKIILLDVPTSSKTITFSFIATLPTLTTTTVTGITAITANSGGNVTNEGGTSVTTRGVCWSTTPNPTIINSKTLDGSGSGLFTSSIIGLKENTTYYVRAFAINCRGTSYGAQVSFSTIDSPTVTTVTITGITGTTATSGGNVTNDGGAIVTSRGVCWSITPKPTITNSKTTDGSGTGGFTSSITGLTPLTTYYVRAYATSSIGTSYGTQINFKTLGLPIVTTAIITGITPDSAISGGHITSNGGAPIIARGVCWSIITTPTIADSISIDGIDTGNFKSTIKRLSPNTKYYARAYATNSVGTSYGNQVIFKTYTGKVTDVDGNIYYTVTINTQVWMLKNLNVTKYRNSNPIPNVTDSATWHNLTTGAYSNYDNIPSNSTTYGKLYNFYAVNDSRKICPTGWHVPTDAEWTLLTDYLGGESIAGGKLMEEGTNHWPMLNKNADNSSGFTALPGGSRNYDGTGGAFNYIGSIGYWWSSSVITNGAWFRAIIGNTINVGRFPINSAFGFSIRCLKD